MITIAGIVDESKVDDLTRYFIDNGWGENYTLITRHHTSDERLYAAPVPYAADTGTLAPGLVVDPDANMSANQTNEGVLRNNLEEEMADLDLSDEEKAFYTRLISDGGTFVAVEVDDDQMYLAQRLFASVDAQQMEVVT